MNITGGSYFQETIAFGVKYVIGCVKYVAGCTKYVAGCTKYMDISYIQHI
jgi:hypothetical protein